MTSVVFAVHQPPLPPERDDPRRGDADTSYRPVSDGADLEAHTAGGYCPLAIDPNRYQRWCCLLAASPLAGGLADKPCAPPRPGPAYRTDISTASQPARAFADLSLDAWRVDSTTTLRTKVRAMPELGREGLVERTSKGGAGADAGCGDGATGYDLSSLNDPAASSRDSWTAIARAFDDADWNLTTAAPSRGGELHPYPARFIPAIPRQALEIVRPQGPVLDPFCGSGTTLLEARRRGLPAIGNDLNPIACLISRVRTSDWNPEDEGLAQLHAFALAEAVSRAGRERAEAAAGHIPRIDHWFDEWSQRSLVAATSYLNSVPKTDPWHDRIALAISACVVRLSRQESDTRYAAIDKPGDEELAANTLSRSVLKVSEWLRANAATGNPPATVVDGDARALESVDEATVCAAVFSPPYPNAYEYWLYHKYRMYWLGHDPISVRAEEIGARPHYCRPNGLDETDFSDQMGSVFKELQRVLRPKSPVVVVLGDSVIGGRNIDNAELLTEAVASEGFDLIAHRQRDILRRRSSFNSSHTRGRRTEHVLLYRSPA